MDRANLMRLFMPETLEVTHRARLYDCLELKNFEAEHLVIPAWFLVGPMTQSQLLTLGNKSMVIGRRSGLSVRTGYPLDLIMVWALNYLVTRLNYSCEVLINETDVDITPPKTLVEINPYLLRIAKLMYDPELSPTVHEIVYDCGKNFSDMIDTCYWYAKASCESQEWRTVDKPFRVRLEWADEFRKHWEIVREHWGTILEQRVHSAPVTRRGLVRDPQKRLGQLEVALEKGDESA